MSEFGYDVTEINEIIGTYLPDVRGFQTTVQKAMNEAVRNGGKRIRPIIMYESCRMFAETCGEEKDSWISDIAPFMAAIEMIHSFSLIQALYVTGKCAAESSNPLRAARAIEILGEKSGLRGMLGGQSVDVEMTGKPLDKEQLDFIYRLKTGALIEACFMIGAEIGGATAKEVEEMEQIGKNVGIAFQIRDDILDITSTEEELGKPIGSDEKNLKTTYVTLYGIEEAEKEVKRLSEEAEQLLEDLPGDHSALADLIRMLIGRRS